MNKKVKKLWIDALENGEYKQGRLQLRNKKDEFCCLGVLCDIYVRQHSEFSWVILPDDSYDFDNCAYLLPDSVRKWAGLDTNSPVSSVTDNHLATLNDSGHSFQQIADIIKEGL